MRAPSLLVEPTTIPFRLLSVLCVPCWGNKRLHRKAAPSRRLDGYQNSSLRKRPTDPRMRHIVHTVCFYNIYTNTVPPRARPGPLRPSSSSGAGLRRPVARQIRLRREGVVAEHHRRCRRSCGGPGARLGGQGRGSSRECSAGASFWVHGTAAGPVREPFRTRSLDGLAGGRYSTTKAPDAAAKDPRTVPGLVVSVGCASRGGEAA